LKKFDKLRTVLINEKYLRGTPDEIGLARRLLVIDSKGIDANAFSAHDAVTFFARKCCSNNLCLEQALGPELAAMHFMGKISALNLFLIPANDIRNCSAAISMYARKKCVSFCFV
jgi:hypothetical protein